MPRACRSVHLCGKRDFAAVIKDHMKLGRISCTVVTRGAQCNRERGKRVTVTKANVVTEAKFGEMNFEDGGSDMSQVGSCCRQLQKSKEMNSP